MSVAGSGARPVSATGQSVLRTLLLTLTYPHRASYYDDWRDAFCNSQQFECETVNVRDLRPRTLAAMVDEFDAVIILHACNGDTLDYLAPIAPVLGNRRRARLLSFVGNEYNSPYVSTVERLRLLGEARCDLIATQLLREAGEFLYQGCGARIISVPHALNPFAFRPGPPDEQRRLDIGYRGYRYPNYLGDDDRNRLIDFFRTYACNHGLLIDVAEDRRLDRSQWSEFLAQCRGTISSEAGSWYLERDDALVGRIHAYLSARRSGVVISNTSPLRRLARRLPSSVKAGLWSLLKRGPVKFEIIDDFNTPFAELDERFFRTARRAEIYGKAISSRHFDAIGSKTCQIMIRGRFNDILTADEHYVAVSPDLSNAGDAIERFKDRTERSRIVQAAYDHVLSAHTYSHRAASVRAAFDALPA